MERAKQKAENNRNSKGQMKKKQQNNAKGNFPFDAILSQKETKGEIYRSDNVSVVRFNIYV